MNKILEELANQTNYCSCKASGYMTYRIISITNDNSP